MACFDRSHKIEDHTRLNSGMGEDSRRERDADRRRLLEKDAHHIGAHFHSLVEHQTMAHGRRLFHDVELERRQNAGYFHHVMFE